MQFVEEVLPRVLTINREFQLFLIGYIIVSICEIFTVGGFPLKSNVRLVGPRSSLWLFVYAYKSYRGLLLFISVQ